MIRQRHRNFQRVVPTPKQSFGEKANGAWRVRSRMLVRVETAMLQVRGNPLGKYEPLHEAAINIVEKAKPKAFLLGRLLLVGALSAAIGYQYYVLNERIDARNRARTQELIEKIDAINAQLTGKLDGTGKDIKGKLEEIEQRQYESAIMLEDVKENLTTQLQQLGEIIGQLEEAKWVRDGGKAKGIERCPEGRECR
jgi:hypothetical protein